MAHRLKFLCQSAAFGLSLVFVLVSSVHSDFLDTEQSLNTRTYTQKRSLTVEEVDLVEVCTSIQSFEQMETAVNVDLLTVEIHPEAWVFATRCRVPGKPCRGFDNDVQSICRPKKSWVQVYGRTSGDTWRPHWVAVDTACVCSIRKKRFMSLTTGRAPLTGKNFLP
ncbi:NGF domain-containing protein [Caerostris darwini]|uniref:NGF domain-containing protein n=1 Tax=Caerostris darwini TaxID=1538125 RepID=A0AAV4VW01_9ARAC|nr:NGF domain-containing protein [Caerostris darwini]